MDLVSEAKQRRAELMAELAEIEAFLAGAERIAARLNGNKLIFAPRVSQTHKRVVKRAAPTSGLVFDTAQAAKAHMELFGDGVRTRDLLPVIEAAGIAVGGQNEVATLSARLGASQQFELRERRWFIRHSGDEGAAREVSGTETSLAAPIMNSNQGDL